MHDGMQYDPIQGQGQGQGHEPLKVGNPSIFKSYLLRHLQWKLATDHWLFNFGTISKFDWAGILIVQVFVSVSRVDRQSRTGLIFLKFGQYYINMLARRRQLLNSITSICCGFVVQQVVQQIHNRSK